MSSGVNRRVGLSWALTSAVLGACMAIPWKLANASGDPALSVLLLLLTAAIGSSGLQLVQGAARGRARRRLTRTDLFVAALLAVITLAGNHLSAVAIREMGPALHAVLLRSDLLFVAMIGWVWLGERVDVLFWLGGFVAVAGLVVLQGGLERLGAEQLAGSGTGYAVAAALCFGLLAIVTRRFIQGIDPVAVNTLRLWLSVGFWFLLNPLPAFRSVPVDQVGYAALAAACGPFLGRLALMQSARHIEARMSTLATLSTPVVTLVIAYVLLDDWPADHELLGGALMVAGIAVPIVVRGRR